MYFLVIGIIMIIGYYTPAFDSAISPWTTLGPLAFVIAVSLLQEGSADYQRHKSDMATNVHPCVVLRNAKELEEDEGRKRDTTVRKGKDVTVNLRKAYFLSSSNQGGETPVAASASKGESTKIAYESVRRMDIRAGDIVLIRNREMVPADVVLLSSSNDKGSAYIETSSIDGETNLKLRNSPHLPKAVMDIINREKGFEAFDDSEEAHQFESLEQATKRVARMSALAFPEGESVLDNPANPEKSEIVQEEKAFVRPASLIRRASEGAVTGLKNVGTGIGDAVTGKMQHAEPPVSRGQMEEEIVDVGTHYLAALSSEAPNASVNTYSGKLTMPPVELGGPGVDIPLNAENMLLRGAVLRNTEWAIGLTVFTGTDTKLVQNSFETPSKFSQLDQLMNKTVFIIIGVMILCIISLASCSVIFTDDEFDKLWYVDLLVCYSFFPQSVVAD
jgi:magnesium-transporting ATPase (P-type)